MGNNIGGKEMRPEERMRLVKEHFNTVSPEEFKQNLIAAGLGELKSWSELDEELTVIEICEDIATYSMDSAQYGKAA